MINHLGISGGKDSTALLLWAVYESGYALDTLSATFADTGNEDQRTLDYIGMLSEKVHPITYIKPKLDFYELARSKRRFPDPRRRFCTVELKLVPAKAHVSALIAGGHDVLMHSGVRAAESAARAALPERAWDEYFDCETYRPLLGWSLSDVWDTHKRYGIPRNPLYDLGAKRVGCFPCIMSCKSELLLIQKRMPERVRFLQEREDEVNALHDRDTKFSPFFDLNKVPLSQRSRTIVTEDGREIKAASIGDVFRWAATSRGGQQYAIDYDDEAPPVCASKYGACE